jgi:hypothetical protein
MTRTRPCVEQHMPVVNFVSLLSKNLVEAATHGHRLCYLGRPSNVEPILTSYISRL